MEKHHFDKSKSTYRFTRLKIQTIIEKLCNFLGDDESQEVLREVIIEECNSQSESLGKFMQNAMDLIYSGSRSTRLLLQAILAKSFSKETFNDLSVQLYRGEMKTIVGTRRYKYLRKSFKMYEAGEDLPKQNDAYRVPASSISNVMRYLEKYPYLPGTMRSVTMFGFHFKNLPVFVREKEKKALIESDLKGFQGKTIGCNAFTDIAKLITMTGKSKAALSSYYVDFYNLNEELV